MTAPALPARCPCCGGAMPGIATAWLPEWQTLIDCGRVVYFTRLECALFDSLWNAKQPMSTDRLIHVFYGDDPDGGPDDPKKLISVYIHRLRSKLAGTSLTIPVGKPWSGGGYRLVHAGEVRP